MNLRPLALAGAIGGAALMLLPALSAPGQTPVRERVEISAPILPRTSVIYAPFPKTLDGERTMAHDAALLFEWLIEQCAPQYPKITLAAPGQPLSDQQLATNYAEVGNCAYEQYSAKPYWIPKLVGDVDICGTEMGPDWRLIDEDDVNSFSEADLQALAARWSPPGAAPGLGFFFNSLRVWVRANDASIAAANLAPGAGPGRVKPLGVSGAQLEDHYEGELALRCIRRTPLPPEGGSGGMGGAVADAGAGGLVGRGGAGAGGSQSAGGAPNLGAGGDATGSAEVCDGITMPADHPDPARDYVVTAATVTDRATGLTWERTATMSTSGAFFTGQCASRRTGELDGWRAPTLIELESIANLDGKNAAFDQASFPAGESVYMATGTPLYLNGRPFGFQGYGWAVDFTTGRWINGLPSPYWFRCVRDAAPHRCYPSTQRFQPTTASAVEEVYDAFTGLTWQRHPAADGMSWESARSYCAGLGGGYRLPSTKELLSIGDLRTPLQPAVDPTAFPATPLGAFWSATKVTSSPSSAFAVDYLRSDDVLLVSFGVTSQQNVRCVR